MKQKDSDAVRLLKRTRYELLRMQQLETKRAQLRSRLLPGSILITADGIQKNAPKDMLAELTADLYDLDRIRVQVLLGIWNRQALVRSIIARIDNPLFCQVLELYYCAVDVRYETAGAKDKPLRSVSRLSLEDIAYRLGMSHGYIRRAHAEAVQAFEKAYRENAPV